MDPRKNDAFFGLWFKASPCLEMFENKGCKKCTVNAKRDILSILSLKYFIQDDNRIVRIRKVSALKYYLLTLSIEDKSAFTLH